MKLFYEDVFKCAGCGALFMLCDGDVLQILQEGLDSLCIECETCDCENEIEVTSIDVELRRI